MSQKWYHSKIFQDVTGEYGIPGAWHHRFQTHYTGLEYKGGEIAVDPQTGIPLHPALLIRVAAIDHTPFQNDDDLVPLPDVSVDVKVSSIHAPTKLKAKDKIKKLGWTQAEVDAVWDNADGLRDVLNHYGRLNNPDFDANNFDLSDL